MAPETSPILAPQPLSAFDLELATDFVSGHEPLPLAASRNMTLADLLAWRNRPEIHQFIADYQQLIEESTSLLAASVRNTLITELIDLVQATPDLLEKRRAAHTLQRIISRPRRSAANLHSTGTPTTPSTPISPPTPSAPTSPSTSLSSSTSSTPSATSPPTDPLAATPHLPVPTVPSSAQSSPLPASPSLPSSSSNSTNPLPDSSPESTSCSSCSTPPSNPSGSTDPLPDPSPSSSSCSRSASVPSSSTNPPSDPFSAILKPDGTIDLAALAILAAKFEAQDDQTLDDNLDDDLDDEPDDDPHSRPAARRGGSSSHPAHFSPAPFAQAANSS